MTARLNVDRLVQDLGGPRALAASIGKPRTAPYRWMNTQKVSSEVLALIKSVHPHLDLDDYFEPVQ